MNIKAIVRRSGVAVAAILTVGASAAHADTTLSSLASGVSFTDVVAGVMAIAAVLMGYYVVEKGAKKVMSFVRGG